MTIEKGEPWGADHGDPVAGTAVSDADLAALAADRPGIVASVRSGDLHRTLGFGPEVRAEPVWLPIDLAYVAVDGGQEIPFVAHVVVRGPLWSGPGAVVMNAAWAGDRYFGPRAHPNDGLLDVTFGALPTRQLWAARERVKSGTHLPHPALDVRRVAAWQHDFERRRQVWVDGQRCGSGSSISVRVVPDHFTVVG